MSLTAERLRELVGYDPETGLLTWAKARRKCALGARVGCRARNGYIYTRIDDTLYLAHRLIWLWVHGRWPPDQIDHMNGVRDDNRLENLREVTQAQNLQNNRVLRKRNTSGITGVEPRGTRWIARIKVNYKSIDLGRFDTAEEARAAYVAAKRLHHKFSTL